MFSSQGGILMRLHSSNTWELEEVLESSKFYYGEIIIPWKNKFTNS